MLFGHSKFLEEVQKILGWRGGGVHKRIDENRELLELLRTDAPAFLTSHSWVTSWLKCNDDFFCALAGQVSLKEGQFLAMANRPGSGFPREWPADHAEDTGSTTAADDDGALPSPAWRAHAYPLQQIAIQLQGTKHSERAAIIRQLETVLARLRAGDLKGHDHDDDFGYRFTVDAASAGPSFFDESAVFELINANIVKSLERHTEALDADCEKYLTDNGMYSIADHLDETDPVDIFTTDGEPVIMQVPNAIPVNYLMRLINHGREQYAKGVADSGQELNEAGRRAGCAERKSMSVLQDPVAVINTMQLRIDQLQRQLLTDRQAAPGRHGPLIVDAVRRLRLHGVIPLYVGSEDFDKVREDVRKVSPELLEATEQVWLLNDAPVDESVKAALSHATNHGMSRW